MTVFFSWEEKAGLHPGQAEEGTRLIEELKYLFNTFVSIFVIVDPFAVVPVYMSLTDRFSVAALRQIRRKATFVALGILMTFALTGMTVFKIFGITLPAFQIAGGLLLLNLGLAQLGANRTRVKPEEADEGLEREDVSIFPLATPLLAGPGSISTVVLQASQASSPLRVGILICALAGALAACNLILKSGPYLFRILGQTGLNLLTRIMGLILTAVAVQFILNGISAVVSQFMAKGG